MSKEDGYDPEDVEERLEKLIEEEDYDECIRVYLDLERRRPLTARELVRKSYFLQLASGTVGELEDVEKALFGALALDEEYVPALVELGWYFYAVENDAKEALPYFRRAAALSEKARREAIEGETECLRELADLEEEGAT